ncbi:4074_t:CDS:2 [Funneliformis geosporum]|uniref:13993_t:CDS:1 n=1 Tax=Funneliformis geosporum TaxID=1117311 RepID=A0A9W4WUM8_9GLOM|nr:4074_t:CDS:2 [Funneliformis geosporum]CAI2180208.1 13993_t:CDS:2 [Funneliformis geosporum]
MGESSIQKEGGAFEGLNDDVLHLIIFSLYEACRYEFDLYEDPRAKHVNTVKKLLPLGYTSRYFANLVLPYVWHYARIIANNSNLRSHNTQILNILKKEQLLFPYGNYLKELEINFTVNSGDEHSQRIPTISSLLQVIAKRCPNIQQLTFLAKVERRIINDYYDDESVNKAFSRYMIKSKWSDFKDLFASAFGQGTLKDVTLSSDFVLVDDDCLTNIAQNNLGIKKLSLRGSQFFNKGIEVALQFLGDSLKELELSNVLGDGSHNSIRSSPLKICIDTLLRPCRNLQTIKLVGIVYKRTEIFEEYTCPIQSITTNLVDEETLEHLFLHTDKRTLSQVKVTSPYDAIKWDSFLNSSVLPCTTSGNLEKLILYILRCRKHRYNSSSLDPTVIMKNIMDTLQISENTVNKLRSGLTQWRILVGKDMGDHKYSVEAEGVDFVSKTCILDYDRVDLSEHN